MFLFCSDGELYTAALRLNTERRVENALDRSKTRKMSMDFVRNFREDHIYIYRQQLVQNVKNRQYYLEVNLVHLATYSPALHDALRSKPGDYIPAVSPVASLRISW